MLGFQWTKWDTNSYHKHNSIYFARCNNVSSLIVCNLKCNLSESQLLAWKGSLNCKTAITRRMNEPFVLACLLSDLRATIVTDLHPNHIRKLAVHGAGQWTHFVYWMTMTHMKRAIELCYTECFGLTNKPVKIVFPITSFLFGFCRQHTLWFAHVCAPGLELFIIANATSQYCTSMFDSV